MSIACLSDHRYRPSIRKIMPKSEIFTIDGESRNYKKRFQSSSRHHIAPVGSKKSRQIQWNYTRRTRLATSVTNQEIACYEMWGPVDSAIPLSAVCSGVPVGGLVLSWQCGSLFFMSDSTGLLLSSFHLIFWILVMLWIQLYRVCHDSTALTIVILYRFCPFPILIEHLSP